MSITYPPELLPMPERGDEMEVVIVAYAYPGAPTAEEMAFGLAIRGVEFDGTVSFHVITPEECYATFPDVS